MSLVRDNVVLAVDGDDLQALLLWIPLTRNVIKLKGMDTDYSSLLANVIYLRVPLLFACFSLL